MSTKVSVGINKSVPPPPNVMVPVNKNIKRNTIKKAETMKSRNKAKSRTLTQKTETSKNSHEIYINNHTGASTDNSAFSFVPQQD
jgi:D-ribose pyranose/furanose isomerase RbsD